MTGKESAMDELRTMDGTTAGIRGSSLEVRDPRGRVLFEYDTTTGRAFFHLPDATLDVRSVGGKIEIGSEQGLRIRSAESVEILGGRSRLEIGDTVKIEAPRLEARLERIDASATEVRTVWGRLEQTVGRLFQWTKNLYLRVEELAHTRAGRVRTESAGAYHVQAESARVQVRDEVKIEGRQIHLG